MKQATLVRRSTVLGLPLWLALNAETFSITCFLTSGSEVGSVP